MRTFRVGVHSHRNRLLLSMIGLVFLTTLATSLTVFGLAQAQLARQRQLQLETAKSAIQSLLLAEQNRVTNQLVLFGERPTLQNLLQTDQAAALELYVQDFRSQSGLDFLAVYRADGTLVASNGRLNTYTSSSGQGFLLLNERPLLAAQQIIRSPGSDLPLGTAVAGIWLEQPFLDTLATATGTQLHLHAPSEIPANQTTQLLLTNSTGQITIMVEVMQPSDDSTINELIWSVGASTAVLTVLGALVSWLLVRRQTTSLQKLTTSAQQIAQGNSSAPLPLVTAPSEMRHLATALHRLQAQLITARQQSESELATESLLLIPSDDTVLKAPGLQFDRSRLEVERDQQEPVRLTPLEARLLDTFMRHPGQVLSSELLITAVWGNDGGDRTMLKQLVYRLRSKIDPDNTAPSHIETISGVGYAFKN